MRTGEATPWGAAQHVQEKREGVWQIDTPGHSGYFVNDAGLAAMPAELRAIPTWAGTAMKCGWGAGCQRSATQAWMRGRIFANALCEEHADSLRMVLPQVQFMSWTESEDASRRIEDLRVPKP